MPRRKQVARKSTGGHGLALRKIAWPEPRANIIHLSDPISTDTPNTSKAEYWKPKNSTKDYLIFVPSHELKWQKIWHSKTNQWYSELIKSNPHIIQYDITLDVDFFIPFYCPNHDNQEICIMDVINEGTKWVVNLLFSGTSSQAPTVYAFAPLSELPSSSVTLNDFGIAVYDSNSDLVFTDSKRPLRIDDVVPITHPSSIRTGSKGSCGYQL